MRFVAVKGKVIERKVIYFLHGWIDLKRLEMVTGVKLVEGHGSGGWHYWEWFGLVLELLLERGDVIEVDVCVAKGVHEVASLQSCDVGDHACQQCIGCNVEWHTQSHVTRSLVHLTRQLSICNIELDTPLWSTGPSENLRGT